MNNNYSNEDYFQMILIYGECNKIIMRTCDLFHQRFPQKPKPSRKTIKNIVQNLRTTGSLHPKKNRQKFVTNDEDNELNVLLYFHEFPRASLRDASRDLDLEKTAILVILKNHNFKPFKLHIIHGLIDADFQRRINYCEFMITKIHEDDRFLKNIIWSDESKIMKNGLFNRHNSHYWSDENPRQTFITHFQDVWSFNVYCAIRYDKVISVHFYDDNLNGMKIR